MSSIIYSREFSISRLIILDVTNSANSRLSRVPHYHAQEATDAIKPLLGDYYHVDKGSYLIALWTAFTACQWVEPDAARTSSAVGHAA